MAIPVIDFSKLEGRERKEVMVQIADGCENWGFFQLVNHGIPVELLQRVKRVCAEYYKVVGEERFRNSNPVRLLNEKLLNSGDQVAEEPLEGVDWEEVITLSDDNEEQWPNNPSSFVEIMKEFRTELKSLAEKIIEVMDENLGLEKGYIKRAFCGALTATAEPSPTNEPFFGTKVSHYPPCPRPDLCPGLRAHTDAGGVILLFQDDRVGGLQVLRSDGQWVDVQPLENAIVINTGDQIEALTNGRYMSAWHRVLATADGNRLSVASFYNPASDATIAPAAELMGVEVEANGGGSAIGSPYPKYVFADYMAVYVKQKFAAKEPRFQAVKAV